MAVGGKGLKAAFLNLDFCFCVWVVTGSTSKMETYFAEKGIVNPETNKRFSRQGLFAAARRSQMFLEYKRKRKRDIGEVWLQTPTVEEQEECYAYVQNNWVAEVEKNRLDVDKYAPYRSQD